MASKKCLFCLSLFVPLNVREKYCSEFCAKSTQRLRSQCRKYGITLEMFAEMRSSQDNSCAICKNSFKNEKFSINIDHDHETKKVRGLLCRSCNLLLGHSKDSKELLKQSIAYLLHFSQSS